MENLELILKKYLGFYKAKGISISAKKL